MSFDKLLGELAEATQAQETLSKALPAEDGSDDQKIQAAAAEGGDSGDKKDGAAAADAAAADGADKGGDKPMAKSFEVTLADGTKMVAEDGTVLIKSLTERLDAAEGTLTKAIEGCVSLIKGQQDMIKSLGEQIAKLRGEGRGRKAVVSITEPKKDAAPLAKSEGSEGLKPEEFMAKALSAQQAGRITGTDVSLAEACLNRGMQVPQHIVNSVLQ